MGDEVIDDVEATAPEDPHNLLVGDDTGEIDLAKLMGLIEDDDEVIDTEATQGGEDEGPMAQGDDEEVDLAQLLGMTAGEGVDDEARWASVFGLGSLTEVTVERTEGDGDNQDVD